MTTAQRSLLTSLMILLAWFVIDKIQLHETAALIDMAACLAMAIGFIFSGSHDR